MTQPAIPWKPEQASALAYTWGQYRVWAATARQQKDIIFSWRGRILWLTIAAAVLATLNQYAAGSGFDSGTWYSLPNILAILSAGSIAVATYFGREMLRPEAEHHWVRARSIAEALKSETYLFRTRVPPYDEPDAASRLNQRTTELLDNVENLEAVSLTPEERKKRLPTGYLTVDQYIEERVDEQINGFYRPRAAEYQQKMARWRTVSLWLGAIGALLGLAGVTGWTAGWIAVITTITTAIATYLFSYRYQYLILSYQATARQLEALASGWRASGRTDQDLAERNEFIRRCEETISIENKAWMSKWTEDRQKPQPPTA